MKSMTVKFIDEKVTVQMTEIKENAKDNGSYSNIMEPINVNGNNDVNQQNSKMKRILNLIISHKPDKLYFYCTSGNYEKEELLIDYLNSKGFFINYKNDLCVKVVNFVEFNKLGRDELKNVYSCSDLFLFSNTLHY